MKLNQREQTILKALQDGKECNYMPYCGRFNPSSHYNVRGIGRCTREITKLIKLGFVIHENKGFNRDKVSLTPNGLAFKTELDEPYDVWVVSRDWGVKVEKYSGFIKDNTLRMASGSIVRKGDNKEFFSDRGKAFKHAIELQEGKINAAKYKLNKEQEDLEQIKQHEKQPELDKSGYL